MNGTDLASQKDIAKSLIKLNLHPRNARALADATGVDADILTSVAASIAAGNPLSAAESEVFARFDLIVTAVLDEAYQRSNQVYRNWTRALAALVAIGLAMAGGRELGMAPALSLLAGLLATPFAPIAKDLSSALTTSVNAMHLAKR